MYGLIYTVPFKDLEDVSYKVEIYKRDFSGSALELKGASQPFVVTSDNEEFLYTPSRFSTAKIRIVGSDYLQSLYSTDYQQYRVLLRREGAVVWTGFIRPEVYSQEYADIEFVLEIECISAMSTLEFLSYEQKGTDGRIFVSLWDLLVDCVSKSNGVYGKMYVSHVYASSYISYVAAGLSGNNVLKGMLISEQNFFDEDGTPMNLKEVIEEICKFLNWTCADWTGDLFFTDLDHVPNSPGTSGSYWAYEFEYYPLYDGGEASTEAERIIDGGVAASVYTLTAFGGTANTAYSRALSDTRTLVLFGNKNVQNLGFAGSDHSLSILGGYNKCSVRTSNYNVGDVFPTEDYDNLKRLRYLADYVWPTDDTKAIAKRFYYPTAYKMRHFSETNLSEVSNEQLANYNTDAEYGTSLNRLLGALPVKRQIYTRTNGTPDIVDYSFDDLIQVRGCVESPIGSSWALGQNTVLLTFEDDLPCCVYGNGAIALDCSMQGVNSGAMNTIGTAFTRTPRPEVKCRLSIGTYFWNGSGWVEDSTATFTLGFNENSLAEGGFVAVESNRTLGDGYNGLSGIVMPLPSTPLYGRLVFEMMGIVWGAGRNDFPYSYLTGYYLKDLKLQYKLVEDYESNSDQDRIYENVINESYINELDEIENKISTDNFDGLCYSKVLLNGAFLTDGLYSAIIGGNVRLEEQLIRRIVDQYNAPKLKLSQVLKYNTSLTPASFVTDDFLPEKLFTPTGVTIDFESLSTTTEMIEK